MASTLVDLVKITVLSAGTGAMTLGSAVEGYRGIEALINGRTYSYSIQNNDQYEVGTGVYLSSGNQFVRSPSFSSDGGTAVNFPPNVGLTFTALADDIQPEGSVTPVVNVLGNDPSVAIAQQIVTQSLTSKYDVSNPAGFITSSALSGYATTSALASGLSGKYDVSNPSSFVNASGALAAAVGTGSGQAPSRNVLAGTGGAALIGTSESITVEQMLTTKITAIGSRTVLKAYGAIAGRIVYLAEANREGHFACFAGSPPASDTLEGLYVVSNTSGFYWARIWDQAIGWPEWFGAVRNNNAVNNAPIIQACISLVPHTVLSSGQYYIGDGSAAVGTDLLAITVNGTSVIGGGASQTSASRCTELVIRSASASGLRIGPASDPGGSGTANWLEGVRVRGFSIRRDVANFPLGNPASGTANAPCGIKMQWAKVCYVQDIYSFEHSMSFRTTATVACHYQFCRGERYSSGTALGNDFAIGFYQDNTTSTPYNSGNASLYYEFCGFFSNMAAGNVYSYAAALQTVGGFTDTYVIAMEGANCGYGLDFAGRTSSSGDWHTEDLLVTLCVMDGCRWDGLRFSSCGPNSAVRVSDSYFGVTMATGPVSRGMNFQTVNGSFSVAGNQTIGVMGNPATGVYVFNSSGVMLDGNIYTNMQDPIYADGAVGCRFKDRVSAGLQGPLTAAAQFLNSQANEIAIAAGAPGSGTTLPKGITMDAACARNEVNMTGINSANVTGGAANKLVYNGSQVTTAGSFGTNNIASGVMA